MMMFDTVLESPKVILSVPESQRTIPTVYPPKDVRFGTQNLKVPYVLQKSWYWG